LLVDRRASDKPTDAVETPEMPETFATSAVTLEAVGRIDEETSARLQ